MFSLLRNIRNTVALLLAPACIGAMMLPNASLPVLASSTTDDILSEEQKEELKLNVRSTDVEAASEGCIIVTVDGTYEETEAEKVLERLNEIRYEACKEGVMNPKDGEPLTLDDYVPLKWSTDLENRALTRAAEASLMADHTRPNGQSCFSFVNSKVPATNETLAWGYGSIIESVNGWYTEKEAYVSQTKASDEPSDSLSVGVTSHYVALINPDNLYVGAADFVISGQRDACAAEFTSETSEENSSRETTETSGVNSTATESTAVSEEQVGSYGSCRQKIEVKTEALALAHIKGNSIIRTGATAEYNTVLIYVGDDGAEQVVEHAEGYVYTSSDENILTVQSAESSEGGTEALGTAVADAHKEGQVVITASIAGAPETLTVEKDVEVGDDIAENAGWSETDRGFQYRKASGELITNKWLKIDGEWYRLDQEGYAKIGWYNERGLWYYFDEYCAMVRGWVASDGKWYYLSRTEGKLQTGWVEFRGRWYYLSVRKGGAMQTGWLESDGATYYLSEDGSRVTGEVEIDGKTYTFGEDGKLRTSN